MRLGGSLFFGPRIIKGEGGVKCRMTKGEYGVERGGWSGVVPAYLGVAAASGMLRAEEHFWV